MVNARRAKNVPGRRTDPSDCQCSVLACGQPVACLLRPEQDVCAVRSLRRRPTCATAIRFVVTLLLASESVSGCGNRLRVCRGVRTDSGDGSVRESALSPY